MGSIFLLHLWMYIDVELELKEPGRLGGAGINGKMSGGGGGRPAARCTMGETAQRLAMGRPYPTGRGE